jgi:hypothetical protein
MSEERKTGTREWADANYNIGKGCAHDCLYCYARANALRFKRITKAADWTKEVVKNTLPKAPKAESYVMYPTTHDITPYYLEKSIEAIRKLLEAGNNVLIVSKPHLDCIIKICNTFTDFKDKILFRFTIGSIDSKTLAFWEPGAPSFNERLASLMYAFNEGFKTSISMEPMLENVSLTLTTFYTLHPYVTDRIWIGKMNKISSRVRNGSPKIETACKIVEENQTDENILWLVEELKNNPKIEWKDSIKEVIEKWQKKLDDKEKYDRETDLFV